MTHHPKQLVVVGGGMVARRLVDALRERDTDGRWAITLLCEEPRAPYDRVALTSYFSGRDPDDLSLGGAEIWDDPLVTIRRGVAATRVDREAREVVIGLVADCGMRGFHAGPIANAAAAEALTSVIININRAFKCHAGIRITGLDTPGD